MKTARTIIAITFAILCTATIHAQNPRPRDRGPENRPQEVGRNAMLRRLNLTDEQLESVRRINKERRSAMEASMQRLRKANQLLDEAVYSDSYDETTVSGRLAEAQAAQSEVIALRTQMESAIRRILTPEQLNRFRMMRQRRENAPGMRPGSEREMRRPGMRPDAEPGRGGPPPRRV